MSGNDIFVFPGMSVFGDESRSQIYPGRIGYFTYSEKLKSLVGLTAAQVGNSPKIYAAFDASLTNQIVARGWEPEAEDRVYSPVARASQLIFRVAIRNDIRIDNSVRFGNLLRGADLKAPPDDYRQFLNREVLVVNEKQGIKCTLISLDGIFKMQSAIIESDEIQIFTRAMEIRPAEEQAFDFEELPGSLVLSENGEAMGIVVSGNETILFAAPLNEYLMEKELLPLTTSQIEEYLCMAEANAQADGRELRSAPRRPPNLSAEDEVELTDQVRAQEARLMLEAWGETG